MTKWIHETSWQPVANIPHKNSDLFFSCEIPLKNRFKVSTPTLILNRLLVPSSNRATSKFQELENVFWNS